MRVVRLTNRGRDAGRPRKDGYLMKGDGHRTMTTGDPLGAWRFDSAEAAERAIKDRELRAMYDRVEIVEVSPDTQLAET